MLSIFGIEVILSDAIRDAEGNPAWRLIPGFSPFLDGNRQGHPFAIEQALNESSFDVCIACHPEFIEDLLKELNSGRKGVDCGIAGQGHRDDETRTRTIVSKS